MRFFGVIGYGESTETPPGSGVWIDDIIEHEYRGEVIRDVREVKAGEGLNDNILVNNSISILADNYVRQHFHKIKYINWQGVLWTVSTVEVRSPRLILHLGGVYNGPTP